MNLTSIDKALVSALPFVLMALGYAVNLGLSADIMWWINLAVAALTPALVYLKANKPPVA